MRARQAQLPHVDTSARAQGRRERGPLARRRWREFGWLTRTVIESENARALAAWPWHAPPVPLTAWHTFCELGISRRWWTVTDVRCLLRPFQLRCLRVPELRGCGDREPCCDGASNGTGQHDPRCGNPRGPG